MTSKTAQDIKRVANIDPWVEMILRVDPDLNPDHKLAEAVLVKTGATFRAAMIPVLRTNRLLTISYGEHLYIIDDPMEILLVLEARAGYRALRKRLASDPVAEPTPNG